MFLVYLGIGVVVLVAILGLMRAAANASPRKLATGVKVGAGLGGGLLGLWLMLTGRIWTALVLFSYVAPLFTWMRRFFRQAHNAGGAQAGQSSGIDTGYLRMTLDHDSGAIDGTVLQGRFAGRRLGELTPDDLLELLSDLRVNDSEGATVLEAYLDRVSPQWRDASAQDGAAAARNSSGRSESAAMSREEAYRILDLEAGASAKDIRDAHRRLMLKLHPDQGGSTYLAAKINQAKDLLLGP